MQLKFPAALGIIFYSLGFPMTVLFLTWYYRIQMKADQLLRAYDLGDDRYAALDGMQFTPRAGRSKSRKTYDIRKKYHKLYYHFKPGKVYWMLVILTRKFCVALFALLFRRNISFMLACVILVLFAAYVLQVRHRPYMSTVERIAVKEAHKFKALEAVALMERNRINGTTNKGIPADLLLHLELNRAIISLRDSVNRRDQKNRYSIKNLEEATTIIKQKRSVQDYYFDYNTVEQVLIMCCIFLSLVAIMFESGQFYETDPVSGISVLRTDDTTVAFYTTILVIGGIVLIGSLIYYTIIFVAEVIGHVPQWVRVLFASRKTRAEKHRESNDMGGRGMDNIENNEDESDFEMSEISVYSNQLGNNEEHKLELRRAKLAAAHAEQQHIESEKQSLKMMDQIRRLKQKTKRNEIQTRNKRKSTQQRTTKIRREMAQVRVGSNGARTASRSSNKTNEHEHQNNESGLGGAVSFVVKSPTEGGNDKAAKTKPTRRKRSVVRKMPRNNRNTPSSAIGNDDL